MSSRLAIALLVTGCANGHDSPRLDARPAGDAAPTVDAEPDAPGVYRHSIVLDGKDDFVAGETFSTTSAPSYIARITWDDQRLYVGYSGGDLDRTTTDAGTKWLFVYLDTDPGAGTGATHSEVYNTQSATFPSGFGAEYYARYKSDGSLTSLQHYSGGAWSTASPAPTTAQTGPYVELAIPLSAIGAGTQLGIVTWMINEKQLAEGTYAGLYAGNFTDGYAANLVITKYLHADFTAARLPNDPANAGP